MKRAILFLAFASCTTTKHGIRTIGGPEEAGAQSVKLEVKNVDLSKFQLTFAPQPQPTYPSEIPQWLITQAAAGNEEAKTTLANWMREIAGRKQP